MGSHDRTTTTTRAPIPASAAFLRILRQWQRSGQVQAIIATHSPILMALPDAELLSLDGESVHPVRLEETEHYRVTRGFLANPDKALAELFDDD